MDTTTLLMLALLPVLLMGSAFFSGTETALFSLSRHERRNLARSKSLANRAAAGLIAETRALLITLLMGNMTINIGYFVTSTVLLTRLDGLGYRGPVLTPLLVVAPLLIIILLGEVLPKLIASQASLLWTRLAAIPMLVVHRTLGAPRWVLQHGVITPLSRLVSPGAEALTMDPDEIQAMLNLSRNQGVIDVGEQQLLRQVILLHERRVRELMVPRVDVIAFDIHDPPAGLVTLFQEKRVRQIPVIDGSLDNVVGMAYAKQVMLDPPTTAEHLRARARQVRFVPEQQRGDRLLTEMRKTGTTVAVVVDEYGGTAGLVTLEDLVERLVGDIPGQSESDPEVELVRLDDTSWRVGAGMSVRDWPAHLGLLKGAGAAMPDTIGGLVLARLGREPRVGDAAQLGPMRFEVEAVDGRRIETLIARYRPEAAGGDA